MKKNTQKGVFLFLVAASRNVYSHEQMFVGPIRVVRFKLRFTRFYQLPAPNLRFASVISMQK